MNHVTYANLADFGKKLLNSTGLEEGLPLIATYSCHIIKAERCSIFVYDKETGELWTTLADGIERIVIDADKGIVGRSIQTKQLIVENDVSKSQYFLGDVDKSSGFQTKNLIVTPIFNEDHKVIGALELLNKNSNFTVADEKFMRFFANFISTFIDLAPR
jgi:GAF domain-containing protein